MKKILCPTDFSEISENAVEYAAKLAQDIGASVHLIHLHTLFDRVQEKVTIGTTLSNSQLTELLANQSHEVTNTFNVQCSVEPVKSVGALAKSITSTAIAFDYVVMGSNGEDDFFQKLFGSTTYRVMKKVGIPVILVPPGCRYRSIRHMVYAFDYWRIVDVPMEKIVAFAKNLGCSLRLVQVMEAYSRDAEQELRATEAVLKETYSKDISLSFHTLYDIHVGHALREYMLKGNYDAISFYFREGGTAFLHTRVIRELSRDTHYPMIVFH